MDIFLKKTLKRELAELGVSCGEISIVQNKDGIIVARVSCDAKSYIIKYFQNSEHSREIENYKILSSLHIPTVDVVSVTDSAVLMEDITKSDSLRLGTKADLDDACVACRIAEWYKLLHTSSSDCIKECSALLYDETDLITGENIEFIKAKTNTQNLSVWRIIEENLGLIISKINSLPRVLTYNDFYYTNLIVAKDKSAALMFDYNLLGKGYVYSDIRNVCFSLGENAKTAFLEAYGKFDESEIAVDNVASVLVTLYHACKKTIFPPWANYALDELKGNYEDKVKLLIST